MKIAIISDTHIHDHIGKMQDIIEKFLSDADMIIHAGDYTSKGVVEILKKTKNFIGVYGNNDGETIRKMLKEKEIIRVEGYKIGVYHGNGSKDTIDNAYNEFKDDKVDVIVFGHSHQPIIVAKNKVLMLNPGSISYRRREKWHSYLILNINRNEISAELKYIIGGH